MSTTTLLAHLDDALPWLDAFYEDLHRHPELSFAEHRTAGLVADRLRELGFTVTEGIGGTGVVGVLENGDGPVVLARADMDALPVTEDTGLPYAADGDAMHACGHDMHVTCLLGAAELFARNRSAWQGTLVALFQPAEEVGTGASAMVDDGLTTRIPRPDVALGQHVMGLPVGTVASRPGPALSCADSVRVTLHGRGSHGSMPHRGIDPILLGSAIVMRLNAVVSRELEPGRFGVLSVGSFVAGAKSNIIPETATLLLNLRAYDEETRHQLRDAIVRIVQAEAHASGCPREPDIEFYDPFPLTENSQEVYDHVSSAFQQHFGERATLMQPSTGSEDFSNLPRAFGAPYLFWYVGGFAPELFDAEGRPGPDVPGNHSNRFAPIKEPTMRTGIEAMTVALASYLGRGA